MQKFLTTCTVLLLAASLVVQVSTATYNTTISVVDPRNNHHHTCSSFECIENVLTHSTQVVFNVSFISLASPFLVKNLSNIALKGTEHTTTVHCNPDTGFKFTGIINLLIENISFTECGSRYEHLEVLAALYINRTINCDIRSVTFYNSSGTGMLLSEARGNVSIVNSLFEYNGNNTAGNGGGAFIKAHTIESSTVNYIFRNCSFIGNRAHASDTQHLKGEGGGISVILQDASNHHIRISDSKFISNLAVWGGALCIIFYNQARHNSLTVENTIFTSNTAPQKMGGAVDLGYKFKVNSLEAPYNNSGLFYNCTFTNNSAAYGGGVSIFSSKAFHWRKKKDEFVFRNCSWDGNTGDYGSAIDISPAAWRMLSDGWTPLLPVFEDCTFINSRLNWETLRDNNNTWTWKQYETWKEMKGRGTFHVTRFAVVFRGKLLFERNTFSAMYLVGSTVNFSAGTDITFSENSGLDGGAIAMIGFSTLRVGNNSQFTFSNNTAERNGGAIYVWSIDRHDVVSTRSCFIQAQQQPTNVNITFQFFNNQAAQGPAIYASSFLPCYYYSCSCKQSKSNTLSKIFTDGSIANFKFEKDAKYEISTPGWKIYNNSTEKLQIIPGGKTTLPIILQDELDNIVDGLYHVVVIRHPDPNSTIQIDEAHSYIDHRQIEVYGKPNDTAIIELSTVTTRKVIIPIEVEMLPCPPGFVINSEDFSGTRLYQCVCSVNTNKTYMGIRHCNIAKSQAYLQRQYWAGYQGEPGEENLLIGRCPSEGLCQQHSEREYLLPNTASKVKLEEAVCASQRTGVLCSQCKKGYSVHYHATSASCFETRHCQLSWLFYILSELVPITVLLVVVMVFNLSFTSGVVNSFILFAQTFDMDLITANRSVWVEAWIHVILTKLHFFYRFFNTELFTIDSLSFCLWKDANSLDIVAFKYVTIVYSLLLIGLVVVLTNICNVNRLFHAVFNPRRVRSYIIHGLTAFLILSYSQCTKITLEILT